LNDGVTNWSQLHEASINLAWASSCRCGSCTGQCICLL